MISGPQITVPRLTQSSIDTFKRSNIKLSALFARQGEFVAAHRQAQRREFAFSFVNAGMKVVMREGTDMVESLNIYYGGVGSTLVKPRQTCRQLVGRFVRGSKQH